MTNGVCLMGEVGTARRSIRFLADAMALVVCLFGRRSSGERISAGRGGA